MTTHIKKFIEYNPMILEVSCYCDKVFNDAKVKKESLTWCIVMNYCFKLLGIKSYIKYGTRFISNENQDQTVWLEIPTKTEALLVDLAKGGDYGAKYFELGNPYYEDCMNTLLLHKKWIIQCIISYEKGQKRPEKIAMFMFKLFPYYKEVISFVKTKCVKLSYKQFIENLMIQNIQIFPDIFVKQIHNIVETILIKYDQIEKIKLGCTILFILLHKLHYNVKLIKYDLIFEDKYYDTLLHKITKFRYAVLIYDNMINYSDDIAILNCYMIEFINPLCCSNYLLKRFKNKKINIKILSKKHPISIDKLIDDMDHPESAKFITDINHIHEIIQKRMHDDSTSENIMESSLSIKKLLSKN
jgi:uncharacterized membrane protein